MLIGMPLEIIGEMTRQMPQTGVKHGVRVMGVGVLVALALAVASLALIATSESARADDYEDCYWINMEGISEETQEATRNALEARGWYSAPRQPRGTLQPRLRRCGLLGW